MRAGALLLCLPALALAQPTPLTPPAPIVLRATTGPMNLTVSSGQTIQSVLNTIPKFIRHPVVVTIGAGTFTGFRVDGFTITAAAASTGASLTIQGTLATATLGAGTASGTATSGTQGGAASTPATHGTVVDSGGTWTTDALRGLFLELTAGPGAGDIRAVESNTGTTVVAAGRFSAAPTSSTTYALRDASTIISGSATRYADLQLGTSSSAAGVILQHNNFPPYSFLIQKMKFAAVSSYGVYMQTPANVVVRYCRFDPGGSFAGISVKTLGSLVAEYNTWPAITGSTYSAILQDSRVVFFALGPSEVSANSNVFVGSGGNNGRMFVFTNGGLVTTYNYGKALQRGFWLGNQAAVYSNGDYFDTVAQHCIATSLVLTPGGTTIQVDGDNFSSCGRAIYGTGRAFVWFTSVASPGSSNTAGIYLEDGARVRSDATGYGFSATTDITLKTLGADVTSTAAAFRLLTPKVLQDSNTQTLITEL